jgi:hypothetical protein
MPKSVVVAVGSSASYSQRNINNFKQVKKMEQLEFLEMELKMLQENITRMKQYKKDNENAKWHPSNSRVVGEFKHRIISLKQRLTLVSYFVTNDLF